MLRPGKLPPDLLNTYLRHAGKSDPRVHVGPRFGEDCAVIDIGERYLVATTDPVTFTTDRPGWYAVHVNANDVATMGAQPAWFQACLLLPPSATEAAVRDLFMQIDSACRELNVGVTGGHTEVTSAVTQPVVVGTMTGIVAKDRLVTTAGMRPGDLVVMTKAAGLEGTGILFHEKRAELEAVLPAALCAEAGNVARTFGISVVRDALLAAEHGATAMHDPTEGGVAMGLFELSAARGPGLRLDLDRIPVLDSTAATCAHFGLDPLGLIGSGALLLTLPADEWPALQRTYRAAAIPAAVIGDVTAAAGIDARRNGRPVPFVYSQRDELLKVLGHTSSG